MVNRKRNIQMKFWVTEEEKRLIDEKMAQLPTKRYGAYLRKMAIDGYIIQVDTTDIKEMTKALGSIGRNINQIAKRVNAGGPAYQADMEEIRERLEQIWQLQRLVSWTGSRTRKKLRWRSGRSFRRRKEMISATASWNMDGLSALREQSRTVTGAAWRSSARRTG